MNTIYKLLNQSNIPMDAIEPLFRIVKGLKDDEKVSYKHRIDLAKEINDEISYLGSNDFAYGFRKLFKSSEEAGVPYEEIVQDVSEKMGVGFSKKISIAENERRILTEHIKKTWGKLSDDQKSKAISQIDGSDNFIDNMGNIDTQKLFDIAKSADEIYNSVSMILTATGYYLLPGVVAAAGFIGGRVLAPRLIGATLGPVAWAASGVWLAVDIAGPGYRKLIPAVIYITLLRLKYGKQ